MSEDNRTLWVGNLEDQVTEELLYELFLQNKVQSHGASVLPEVVASPSNAKHSQSLLSMVCKEDSLKAEILWTLFTINKHHSFASNVGINKIFQRMFPDSTIAKQFSLSEKKCSYLASFGLAPYFTCLLEGTLRKANFVLMFDESMNKSFQTKQMDFHVRFWDGNLVKSYYFTSKFLGHATAVDMQAAFEDASSILNLGNLMQLSMDGPNVNWAFHAKIDKLLVENYGTELLNVGSCGLHKVHGAGKTAMVAVGWGLEKVLKSMYKLLEDTPARREDYFKASESMQAPLQFCSHRWLENSKVAQRALEILPNYKKYLESVAKKEIPKPKTESFETVKTAVFHDSFLRAKLAFFISFNRQLEPFLQKYQTDKPMLPFLFTDLHSLTFAILRRFVKKDIIASLSSTGDILKFEAVDTKNHVTSHEVDIGFVAEGIIKDLEREKKASDLQVLAFRNDCKTILSTFMEKFLAKSPLHYLLVKDLACLDPHIILLDKDNAARKLKRVLQILVKSRKFNAADCDLVISEYFTLIEQAASIGSLSAFSKETDRLDTFYHNMLSGKRELQNIWNVIQSVLILSHGQATVERGFSVNREIEDSSLAERTLIARRIIVDSIRNMGGIDSIEITPKMLTSASSAYSKYMLHLDSEREKAEQHKKSNKRKLCESELETLKRRKVTLEKDITVMAAAADENALKAEKERNFSLISVSNSLRKTLREKEGEVKSVNKLIDEKQLEMKRQDM